MDKIFNHGVTSKTALYHQPDSQSSFHDLLHIYDLSYSYLSPTDLKIENGGTVFSLVADQIISDDHDCETCSAEILLCARVNQAKLRGR